MPVHLSRKGENMGSGLMFPKVPTKKKRKRHHPSIMHNKEDRTCFLCMLFDNNYNMHYWLHEHHVFLGDPNRDHAEEYGLKVYLCVNHHELDKRAPHRCAETRKLLEAMAQRKFEETYPDEDFRSIFGKNCL